jgi:hypothetical protein
LNGVRGMRKSPPPPSPPEASMWCLLGCWFAGLLVCWVAGLLGCWVAGLLGWVETAAVSFENATTGQVGWDGCGAGMQLAESISQQHAFAALPICRLTVAFTGEGSCSRQAGHPRPGRGRGPLRPCRGPLRPCCGRRRRGPARPRLGGHRRHARGRRPPQLLPPRWIGGPVVS